MAGSRAMEALRANVRKLLDEQGKTVTWLAETIGTQQPNLSRLLNGENGCTVETAERIADALGLAVSELFTTRQKKVRQSA